MAFINKLKNALQKKQEEQSVASQFKNFFADKQRMMNFVSKAQPTTQKTTQQTTQQQQPRTSYFANKVGSSEWSRQTSSNIKATATPDRLTQFRKEQEEKRKQEELQRKLNQKTATAPTRSDLTENQTSKFESDTKRELPVQEATQVDTNKVAEVKNGKVEFRDKNIFDKAKEQYKYMQLTPTNLSIASKEISTMGDIVGNASLGFFTGIPKAIGHLEENAERKIGKDLMQKAKRGGDVYQWLEQHPEQQSKLSQEEIEGFKQISDYKKSIEDTSKYFTNLGENGGKITQLNDWAGISAVKENAQKQIMASQQDLVTPFGKKMGDLLPSTVDSSLGMAFSMINPVLRIIFV